MKNSPRNVSMNLDTKERDLMSVKKLPKDGSPRPSHTDADSSLLVISDLLQAHKRLREVKEIEQRVQNHEKTKIENISRENYLKNIYRMPIHGSPHEEKILFPSKPTPSFGPKLLYQINKA